MGYSRRGPALVQKVSTQLHIGIKYEHLLYRCIQGVERLKLGGTCCRPRGWRSNVGGRVVLGEYPAAILAGQDEDGIDGEQGHSGSHLVWVSKQNDRDARLWTVYCRVIAGRLSIVLMPHAEVLDTQAKSKMWR